MKKRYRKPILAFLLAAAMVLETPVSAYAAGPSGKKKQVDIITDDAETLDEVDIMQGSDASFGEVDITQNLESALGEIDITSDE